MERATFALRQSKNLEHVHYVVGVAAGVGMGVAGVALTAAAIGLVASGGEGFADVLASGGGCDCCGADFIDCFTGMMG